MYKQLAAWNANYGEKLQILCFPSDEFGGQELPTAEIAPFLAGFKLTKDLPLAGGGCWSAVSLYVPPLELRYSTVTQRGCAPMLRAGGDVGRWLSSRQRTHICPGA